MCFLFSQLTEGLFLSRENPYITTNRAFLTRFWRKHIKSDDDLACKDLQRQPKIPHEIVEEYSAYLGNTTHVNMHPPFQVRNIAQRYRQSSLSPYCLPTFSHIYNATLSHCLTSPAFVPTDFFCKHGMLTNHS